VADLLGILIGSLRDGFVQVSAFVAITVLVFGLVQYRTDGALLQAIEDNERLQPVLGGLMGLTPGCGGAIVMMPLYIRGSVSFGTVVATLVATAGDSAFVILALAPEAAVYAYGLALVSGIAFGYLIDNFGLGIGRVDRAVARFDPDAVTTDGGTVVDADGAIKRAAATTDAGTADGGCVHAGGAANPAHDYGENPPTHTHDGPDREGAILTPLSHVVHVAWWAAGLAGLALGVSYLLRGAPEVPLELGLSFAGLFTVFGLTGTALSFYLYFVGRHYIGEGEMGRARESFASAYETFQHAAMETSFVTVWVIVAYLLYEYGVVFMGIEIQSVAMAAGVLAPIGGALVGLIPGCAPQILLAGVYAEGGIPFSALTANAISQDGDALFPLLAIDKTAAVVASIYTTIPAIVVGVGLHYVWPYAQYGFGTLA
jgi:hypothetical protein